ncbi:hypothetical protein [Bartonella koehlerae]|uniref:Uncharacterized protein n=1 Tax=Bartonella koehlerae C-29 TaxID=1134510 RepID=A0A067WAN2_9HYPH|nr:hypothetical protein O9A_00186 [Bartonella koehlerae C-29]
MVGHAPWGVGVAEYFYNLYEYLDGFRKYGEFDGGQYYDQPENVCYSTKAEVEAWLYGGNLPRSMLNYESLIDEVNREIKKLSKTGLILGKHNEELSTVLLALSAL